MVTYVKIDVDTNWWWVREPSGDDWDNGTKDGDVSIERATIVSEDNYDVVGIDADLKEGDIVYLVWARYGTGDSFGSYGGNYVLLDLLTDEALAYAKRDYYETVNDYSVPWTGYFEWLQDLHVETLILEKGD